MAHQVDGLLRARGDLDLIRGRGQRARDPASRLLAQLRAPHELNPRETSDQHGRDFEFDVELALDKDGTYKKILDAWSNGDGAVTSFPVNPKP